MSSAEPSTGKPPPGSPIRPSSGTTAPSKCTSARLSRLSVRIGNSPIVMPGVFGSTRNAVTPLCFCARSSVATTKKRPACAACEMKTLVPSSRQPPATRVAVVCMLGRSVPPPGSVRQAEVRQEPSAMRGSQRSFCASLPKRRIELATSEFETDTTEAITQSMRASSSQMTP